MIVVMSCTSYGQEMWQFYVVYLMNMPVASVDLFILLAGHVAVFYYISCEHAIS